MQIQSLFALLPLLAGLASRTGAVPIYTLIKREVPQEKSHASILQAVQTVLQQDNPLGIVDPVFGLLGNAAAAAGAGQVTNTDCLQQATADQAFTNAKAANDVAGMTAALTYRALERNTGQVGLASVLCTETPVNPEIAAISRHQDPASADAAATNKAITLALAQQIAAVGGDPLEALKSGTFAPGDTSDPTGKGNSCDDDDCIFTQNLLVEDATEEEINAAVAGVASTGTAGTADTATATDTTTAGCPAVVDDSATGNTTSTDTTDTATGTDDSTDTADSTATTTNTTPAAGIDVGQCTDFSLTFAAGLDGRKADEFTFQPTDLTNFNHGSALNPSIITQFMCDTFVNACANSATTRDVCKTVAADLDAQLASGALQRDQGFADAWLTGLESAFGIQSTGTGTGSGAAAADTAASADDATVTSTAATADSASTATATAATGDADTSTTATGDNLQTFSEALNGVAATPVINIGGTRPLQVKADTFVNAGAAFQRSCDQQFNGCANAANSGSGDASVAECSAQKDRCSAATPQA
ncbi:hypothetical protein I203_107862 [Kwoniella mangroviensis CBS 8507]|uniref:hypothetical protein n=1 Tax=Kwoniella mangroviensis CBS 8507 TaxID=1296122 RepID=UPI00080D2EB0|nr:uncharacterized protein I203_08169 [Kwoniella mangroviensis CBS 8507]OCF62757.1 hypothetical protein I203_08169 [Kwoniella mangroviensis CBS 8507]